MSPKQLLMRVDDLLQQLGEKDADLDVVRNLVLDLRTLANRWQDQERASARPLAYDRLEDDVAVLADEAGRRVDWPRDRLPDGTRPGEVLAAILRRDPEATRAARDEARRVQDDLAGRDPGGDVRL